jgi:hypothetical protein
MITGWIISVGGIILSLWAYFHFEDKLFLLPAMILLVLVGVSVFIEYLVVKIDRNMRELSAK